MQPEEVLRAQEEDEQRVLLHEMLHALVESEAGARTPLWLREGLVEVLAGEAGRSGRDDRALVKASVDAMERSLRAPASWEDARRAHAAARQRVSRMVARYGMGTVRRWLAAGVPEEVRE